MSGRSLGGRPVKWTPAKIKQLRREFFEYLYAKDEEGQYKNQVPSVSQFAFEHHISRQRLYEFEELKEVIQLCHTKKESDLELGALSGVLNPSMAIFSLKQLGWTDRQEVEHSGQLVIINDDISSCNKQSD